MKIMNILPIFQNISKICLYVDISINTDIYHAQFMQKYLDIILFVLIELTIMKNS